LRRLNVEIVVEAKITDKLINDRLNATLYQKLEISKIRREREIILDGGDADGCLELRSG